MVNSSLIMPFRWETYSNPWGMEGTHKFTLQALRWWVGSGCFLIWEACTTTYTIASHWAHLVSVKMWHLILTNHRHGPRLLRPQVTNLQTLWTACLKWRQWRMRKWKRRWCLLWKAGGNLLGSVAKIQRTFAGSHWWNKKSKATCFCGLLWISLWLWKQMLSSLHTIGIDMATQILPVWLWATASTPHHRSRLFGQIGTTCTTITFVYLQDYILFHDRRTHLK